VPTIRITFQNNFPELAGQVGTLEMRDVNGNILSIEPLVYEPNTTVDLLYPGTEVNPDGSIADVPGWELNDDGFWVLDPSDAFLREGIQLTYTVNPTASAFVTYPPESAACANPDGPFPPGADTPPPGGPFTPEPTPFLTPEQAIEHLQLAQAGRNIGAWVLVAGLALGVGLGMRRLARDDDLDDA